MHEVIREAIAKILMGLPKPSRVLEVGATRQDTLLTLPSVHGAWRVGINPDPRQTSQGEGWAIVEGSGWALPWPDGHFDLVLCNSVLEHDRSFWRTLAEMKRVLRGHLIVGVPAFVQTSPGVLGVHRFPKDYYRFGEDAVREVFFEGLTLLGLQVAMPDRPRIIAWGHTRTEPGFPEAPGS